MLPLCQSKRFDLAGVLGVEPGAPFIDRSFGSEGKLGKWQTFFNESDAKEQQISRIHGNNLGCDASDC